MRALLLAAALAAGCSAGPSAVPVAPRDGVPVPADAQQAQVVRVSDGDTVVLRARGTGPLRGDRTRVRLLLVDTPEVFDRQECLGKEATDRTAELLPEGSPVRVQADEDPEDRYGRALLHVWNADGVNVGEQLLREGLANVLVLRPNDLYLDAFRAAESEAQDAGRGIWSQCPESER